jgi:hypothetical protein
LRSKSSFSAVPQAVCKGESEDHFILLEGPDSRFLKDFEETHCEFEQLIESALPVVRDFGISLRAPAYSVRVRRYASPRTAAANGEYAELFGLTGLKTFVTTLAGHITAETART